ncbi:MAG: hypothetical protein ACE5KZ_08660 [Candidatus Scalinduaceae bacterium]
MKNVSNKPLFGILLITFITITGCYTLQNLSPTTKSSVSTVTSLKYPELKALKSQGLVMNKIFEKLRSYNFVGRGDKIQNQARVAILPPVSWEAQTQYLFGGKIYSETYTSWREMNISALHTSRSDSNKFFEKDKLIRERSKKLRPVAYELLWELVRQKTGEVLKGQGLTIIPFREVDNVTKYAMLNFYDEDERSPENISAFARATQSSYVIYLETLSTDYYASLMDFWVSRIYIALRLEVYDEEGNSKFVAVTSGTARDTEVQEAWIEAINLALRRWLKLPDNRRLIKTPLGSTASNLYTSGWAAAGFRNNIKPINIPRGSKVLLIVHPSSSIHSHWAELSKPLERLQKLKYNIEKKGYTVIGPHSLNELLKKPKDYLLSSYYRSSRNLIEVGKSLNVRAVLFIEIRGNYIFSTNRDGGPSGGNQGTYEHNVTTSFIKAVDLETGDVVKMWRESREEATRKWTKSVKREEEKLEDIPYVIFQ